MSLVAFLEGTGPDHRGRTIEDVLAMPDAEIERHHDFVQWLFPLPEPSRAVPGSPVLSEAEKSVIRRSPAAQRNLARGLERMRAFFTATSHWLTPDDHNHQRISRIIRSTALLCGPEPARAFHDLVKARVDAKPGSASERTIEFWQRALSA